VSTLRDLLQAAFGDDLTLGEELSGGMSRVFVAEERDLGRRVVVKALPPDLGSALSVKRFLRESRVAARLQHPHIVLFFDNSPASSLDRQVAFLLAWCGHLTTICPHW
jgi:eukaryotic-like serine/threonine-protein kinase